MEILIFIIKILSYLVVILAIALIIFLYVSLIWYDRITKNLTKKIKENKKEVIKIILQDLSLAIQLSVGFGTALILFALSLTGIESRSFLLFGLIAITTGIFLLVWRYVPLRSKIYSYYNQTKN
jgi:hypothetical protein